MEKLIPLNEVSAFPLHPAHRAAPVIRLRRKRIRLNWWHMGRQERQGSRHWALEEGRGNPVAWTLRAGRSMTPSPPEGRSGLVEAGESLIANILCADEMDGWGADASHAHER